MAVEGVTNALVIDSGSGLDVSPEGDFFKLWVQFLKPLHHLTSKEMELLAAFLKKRYELEKVISDSSLLETVLMNEDTKREGRKSCGVTPKHFQVIMSRFRKNGVLKNGRIHLKLIPHVHEEGVGLMVYFKFNAGDNRKSAGKGSKETGDKSK